MKLGLAIAYKLPMNVLRKKKSRYAANRLFDSTIQNRLLSKAIWDPFYYSFICHFEAVSASISFRLLALVVMLIPFLIPMPYFLIEKKDLMLRPDSMHLGF